MIASTAKRPTRIDELISPQLSARLDRLDVVSRRVFAGKLQGERRSKRRGQSVEFADHRNYVPGDDLRRIDWNAFARLDKFFIRIFQEEEDLSVHLVVDASPSMDAGTGEAGGGDAAGGGGGGGGANKLLFSQRLSMALGYIGLVNNNRLTVSVFDNQRLQRLEPVRGRRNVQRLGQFLLDAVATPTGPTQDRRGPAGDFTSALKAIAMTRTGKGVMVLLSDFLIPEGYEEGLRYLAGSGTAGGYETYCLQVLSPGELDPGAAAGGAEGLLGDLRLTDAETGRSAEVTVTADLIKRYKEAVERYTADLRSFCTARGMSYALVRSDTEIESLLIDYLRRRGLLQ